VGSGGAAAGEDGLCLIFVADAVRAEAVGVEVAADEKVAAAVVWADDAREDADFDGTHLLQVDGDLVLCLLEDAVNCIRSCDSEIDCSGGMPLRAEAESTHLEVDGYSLGYRTPCSCFLRVGAEPAYVTVPRCSRPAAGEAETEKRALGLRLPDRLDLWNYSPSLDCAKVELHLLAEALTAVADFDIVVDQCLDGSGEDSSFCHNTFPGLGGSS
jgi:hypothetical protein